jgi:integrase
MPWKKGRKWIGQVRDGSRRIQKVFTLKADAISWESDQKEVPANQWKTRSTSSLLGLANDYLAYSRTKHSPKTFGEKHSLFKRFLRHIDPNMRVCDISPDDIRKYLQEQSSDRSGYAANKDRKNLLAFFSWLARYKGLVNPCVSVCERFPEERQARYVPPEEDYWKILEMTQGQDRTMLLAYLHLAARRSELFRLRWDDIDWGNRKLRLFTKKRKDGSFAEDWLPITDDLFDCLQVHRDFVAGEWVFPAPGGGRYLYRQHLMGRICRRAGVRPFGFHAIRHLSASLLAQADVPMVIISQILRHRSLAVTERYLKRMGDLKGALELLKKPSKIF